MGEFSRDQVEWWKVVAQAKGSVIWQEWVGHRAGGDVWKGWTNIRGVCTGKAPFSPQDPSENSYTLPGELTRHARYACPRSHSALARKPDSQRRTRRRQLHKGSCGFSITLYPQTQQCQDQKQELAAWKPPSFLLSLPAPPAEAWWCWGVKTLSGWDGTVHLEHLWEGPGHPGDSERAVGWRPEAHEE